jgi:hypothetical protein
MQGALKLGVAIAAFAVVPTIASAQLGGLGDLGDLGDVVNDVVDELDEVIDEVDEVVDEVEGVVEDITDSYADVDVDLSGEDGLEADVCVGLGNDCDEDGGGIGVNIGISGGGGGGSPGGGSPGGGGGGGGGGGLLLDPRFTGAIGPGTPQVCFYTLPNFGGQSFCLYAGNGFLPLLGEWADRIASIQVIGQVSALICDNANLTGSCLVIRESIPIVASRVFSIQLL